VDAADEAIFLCFPFVLSFFCYSNNNNNNNNRMFVLDVVAVQD
jgi:hypothetical protein